MAITNIITDLSPLAAWLSHADAWKTATSQSAIDDGTNHRIVRWDSQATATLQLAQATANSQPKFVGASRINEFPALCFENSSNAGANVGMTVTLGSAVGNRSSTFIIVSDSPHRQEHTTAGRNAMVGITGAGRGGIAIHRGLVKLIDAGADGATGDLTTPSTVDSGLRMPQGRSILVVRAGNGTTDANYTVWSNKRKTTVALRASATSTNFILGASTGPNNPWTGRMYAVYVWNSALTDTQIGDAIDNLSGVYNVNTNPDYNLIVVGDSISSSGPLAAGTGGYVVPLDVSWPTILSNQLGGQVTVHNCSTSSQTAEGIEGDFTNIVTPAIITSNGAGLKSPVNIMCMFIGTNDITNNSKTANEVEQYWRSIIGYARARGVSKVIGIPCIPRATAALSIMNDFNTALVANYRSWGIDYIVPIAGTPLTFVPKSVASADLNRLLYHTDSTHLYAQGMPYVANEVLKCLKTNLGIGSEERVVSSRGRSWGVR